MAYSILVIHQQAEGAKSLQLPDVQASAPAVPKFESSQPVDAKASTPSPSQDRQHTAIWYERSQRHYSSHRLPSLTDQTIRSNRGLISIQIELNRNWATLVSNCNWCSMGDVMAHHKLNRLGGWKISRSRYSHHLQFKHTKKRQAYLKIYYSSHRVFTSSDDQVGQAGLKETWITAIFHLFSTAFSNFIELSFASDWYAPYLNLATHQFGAVRKKHSSKGRNGESISQKRQHSTHHLSNAILDNMVTSTLMLDEQLYVRYANPAAEQLFSQSARRIVDHPLSHLIQHASLDLALLTQLYKAARALARQWRYLVVDNRPLMLGDG